MDFLRPLGATGMRVSAIGLGTVKLGRTEGLNYPSTFTIPSDAAATEVLAAAADLGINLIDTAPAYGTSESRLGELMKRHAWFGGRDRWIVSTKVGEEFENARSRFDFSPNAVTASVHRSLARLGVDALDLVLIHSSGDDENILRHSGAVEALADLKRRGTVRAIGISSKTVAGGLLALELGLDVLMIAFNASDDSQRPVLLEAKRRNAGILIKKGLASGHAAVAGASADPVRHAMSFVFNAVPSAVSSIVVGTINPAHLRENVETARALLSNAP